MAHLPDIVLDKNTFKSVYACFVFCVFWFCGMMCFVVCVWFAVYVIE